MTDEDKACFDLIEAKELFMATPHPDSQLPPEKCTTETLERINKSSQNRKTHRKKAKLIKQEIAEINPYVSRHGTFIEFSQNGKKQ